MDTRGDGPAAPGRGGLIERRIKMRRTARPRRPVGAMKCTCPTCTGDNGQPPSRACEQARPSPLRRERRSLQEVLDEDESDCCCERQQVGSCHRNEARAARLRRGPHDGAATTPPSDHTQRVAHHAKAHQRWSWPRWPHELLGANAESCTCPAERGEENCSNHYDETTPRTPARGRPHASKAAHLTTPQSSILLFVLLLVTGGALLIITNQVRTCSAYQLTNNLIANNLPPKFVHSGGPAGSPGLGGGSATGSGQTNSEIVVRVKEGPQSIGKLIYTLKGEDPDEDPLTFGVLGTMASELLRIENVPGNQANVYLRKELDRETTESHQVVITLTDGKLGRGNWITKSMLIIVEDINDNFPVFGPHRTAISIREDARAPLVIETIEASDADEGRFGQVIYKLDESSAEQLSPAATTGGGGSESSSASGANGAQRPIGEMFSIETVDGRGVISLIGQLDYESRPLYQLRILAIDRAHENERLSTSTSILISVEDCEDQPPMFTFAPSITRIPEDSPVGSAIVRVSAIDGDRGVNSPIKYSIVTVNGQEAGFERNLFSIGSDSGQIRVAHELDRELSLASPTTSGRSSPSSTSNQPGAYVIQVRAAEVGESSSGSPAEVTTELTVILIDVNDELPTFDAAEYAGELLENSPAESLVTFVRAGPAAATTTTGGNRLEGSPPGQLLPGARVTDRDQGTNGTFTLHLEGEHGHLFEVWPSEATNEANLMLKVASGAYSSTAGGAKFFDYERTKELRLSLVAREKFPSGGPGGERFSTAEMVIRLRDANDNYPQFDTDLYRVEIPENANRGMHICAVRALDGDSGALGTAGVRYTEIRGERASKFKLDPLTGLVTLKTSEHGFDRESVAQHHLIVEARDNLGLGNRNTTQLLIVLTDVNDQRPKFALDQYEAFIYENEIDFQSPLQVQAHDSDAAATQNSRITYSIVAGDPQQNFTIDPFTGQIRVRTSLVAGSGSLHEDSSSRNSSRFAQSGSAAEESEMFLGGSQHAGAGAQLAGLDFERIAQKRDDTRQFNLTVRAQDAGSPEPLASTTQVIVLVYDKNDHAPVFTRSVYSKSLREDLPGGSPVVQVQAHDGDHSPTNSKITYRISSGGSDKFVIDSDTGLISIANGANLDIDRVQGGGARRTSYLLNVLASDGSFGQSQKSSSCLVNITIIDVNNKPPEFVSLGGSQQQPVGQVPAGSNLQTAGSGSGGRIPAGSPLAGPGGSQHVFVNEDAPYGLIVTRVFATDLDSSAELRYSINYARSEARNEDMALVEPALYRDVFAIEPTDGTIKVNKQLDRELFDQVKLRLQVEDLAAQTADQVAHTYLLIRITDVNDNRPTFKKSTYKAVVNENSISGTSVITMAADDRDLNKTLRYSLEASSPELARLVRINPRSGEVTVNDKIDRELYPLINLTIKAEDSGQPHSLTGSAQLVITVRDENDNNPIFLNSTHLRPLAAASPATTTTTGSRASPSQAGSAGGGQSPRSAPDQPGEPQNHNMNYHLASGGAESPASSYRSRSLGPPLGQAAGGRFMAEEQPPILDLSEEQFGASSGGAGQPSHHFVVLGSGPPPQAPHDENGHELALLAPGSSARVREDAPVGHQIAYVRAEDADVGNNGRVTYLLDPNSSGGGKFRIDRDTGILSVAQPLDREQQKHYTLIIEACDNFDLGYSTGESRRAFTQVAIQVGDINDNAPTITSNLHHTSGHHHHHASVSSGASLAGGSAGGQAVATYPTYEEAMNSPGPFEMPLAECLFIDEFQPLGEPILTLTATDPDDPELPNGQIDMAIINNNLPASEMFSLVPVRAGLPAGPARVAVAPQSGETPVSLVTTTTSAPPTTSDLSGFGDQLVAASSPEERSQWARRLRRSAETGSNLLLQPGTFYGGHASSPARARLGMALTTTTTTSSPTTTMTARIGSSSRATPTSTPTVPPTPIQVQTIAGGEQQMHVVVSQSLRERVGNYSILVRATDRGQPALSSVKLVNICVLDVNNHAPVFTRPPLNHTIRIMENSTIGSYVTQVEATDQDQGLNGELQYSLKATNIQSSNNDWQSFKIDRLSGVITTTKLFNRQLKKYYTLRVQAQDFGRPTSLASDIDINIMIVNSGSYQPEFEQQSQSVAFTENVAPGLEWFKLLATTNLDDDPALINANHPPSQSESSSSSSGSSASNWLSSPCYYIIDGDDHEQAFHLDKYTHKLTNQRELDREKKSNYTLIVQASNNCNRSPSGASSRLLAPPPPATPSGGSGANQEVSLTTGAVALSFAGPSRSVVAPPLAGEFGSSNRRERIRRATAPLKKQAQARMDSSATSVEEAAADPQVAAQNSDALSLAAHFDTLLASDKSLMRVYIKIKDVNDNAPRFTQKIYTGGITTEADFGTVFMIVQAIDADAEANAQVSYSIVKPIKRNLSLHSGQASAGVTPAHQPGSGPAELATGSSPAQEQPQHLRATQSFTRQKRQAESNSLAVASTTGGGGGGGGEQGENSAAGGQLLTESDDLFVVNAQTGEISLNFDPQKHMKGYFEFEIQARDPDGLSDSARVLIYLLRQDQRVKFVLRLTPQELRARLNKFRSVFGNITGAHVNIDSYKYFENHDGTVDKKKTSLFLHFVQPEDNTIIEVDKVLTLIDNNIEYLDELYKEFHVLSSEAAHLPLSGSGALVDPIDQVRTGLMGVSSFLALILILVIALCLNQRTRYERQLKAATVSAFGSSPLHLDPDFHTQTNLPNTNLHSQDPNPIWINGHHYGASGAHDLVGGPGGLLWAGDEATRSAANPNSGGQGATKSSKQRPTSRTGNHHHLHLASDGKKQPGKKQQQQQEIFHSASSGVGMALDDDEDDVGLDDGNSSSHLDELSTSGGDLNSSDLNSLSGHHRHHNHHHHAHNNHYKATSAATATPRDSLTSSHGQVSSASSGSNSASTTNERQVLCSASENRQQKPVASQQQAPPAPPAAGQTKAKANSSRPGGQSKGTNASTTNNSTFGAGAYKEVTIYTEQQSRQPVQSNTNNNKMRTNNGPQNQTSHVKGLASQFNGAKMQQQQANQSIYVTAQQNSNLHHQQAPLNLNNQKKAHNNILVHSNGADVNQGIIKTTTNANQQGSSAKQLIHILDAKFVPPPTTAQANQGHNHHHHHHHHHHQQNSNKLSASANAAAALHQEQSVNNFESSISKLSILNLETTEL